VTFDDLLLAAGVEEAPEPYVMAYCDVRIQRTNLPIEDLSDGKGMIATQYEGLPIPPATAVRLGCSSRIFISGTGANG
jgi:hypothetical protein